MKKREKTDSYYLLPFLAATIVVVVIAVVAVLVLSEEREGITMKEFVGNYETGRYTDPNEQVILVDTVDTVSFEGVAEITCLWFTSCPYESCPDESICFDGDLTERFDYPSPYPYRCRAKVTFLVHQKDSLLDESQMEVACR